MNTSISSPAHKWYDASAYKLYVRPATGFDKASLMAEFSQYAEVVDAYVSNPSDNGFQWAFVYFVNEEGVTECIERIQENNPHNFVLNRPKPKVFQSPGTVPAAETVTAKILNGVGAAQTNGIRFVSPPNCASCKKITFQQCISCKNPFCSTECSLDGWRMHTGSCIQVAELMKVAEPNEAVVGNALATTVVNFMKDCKYSKKKFTTNEFAEACNFRGKTPSTPEAKEETIDYVPNIPPTASGKHPHSSNFDKSRRNAASFPKPNQPTTHNGEVHYYGPATNDNKSTNRAPPKKHNKFGENKDRGNRRNFLNSTALKSPNYTDHANANIEGEENWDLDVRKRVPPRKPTQKFNSDNEDTEDKKLAAARKSTLKYNTDNEDTVDKPATKQWYQKQNRRNSDTKETAPFQNGYSSESEKRIAFKTKSPNDQSKRPVRSREPKIVNTPVPETDLKLEEHCSVRVVVTSVVDETTFYVANSHKVVEMLRQITDCAKNAPELKNAQVNTQCLAFFEGDWYRAKILSTNPIEVEYIDYGNRELCEIENLKHLPESLTKYLPLASRVKLYQNNVFQANIKENKEYDIYVREYEAPSNSWIIDVL